MASSVGSDAVLISDDEAVSIAYAYDGKMFTEAVQPE